MTFLETNHAICKLKINLFMKILKLISNCYLNVKASAKILEYSSIELHLEKKGSIWCKDQQMPIKDAVRQNISLFR